MLIRADRFSTLPEGCPVLVGDAVLPGTIREPIGKGYRVAIAGAAPMAGGAPSTTIAWAPRMQVDLSTPAAVRAFAPALIAQLLPAGAVGTVAAIPDDLGQWHLCIVYGQHDGGLHIRGYDAIRGACVVEATPEACLLAGLKAALDAAKDAQ